VIFVTRHGSWDQHRPEHDLIGKRITANEASCKLKFAAIAPAAAQSE
jgi:hypothetical protein